MSQISFFSSLSPHDLSKENKKIFFLPRFQLESFHFRVDYIQLYFPQDAVCFSVHYENTQHTT